jgi:hypothetical protein
MLRLNRTLDTLCMYHGTLTVELLVRARASLFSWCLACYRAPTILVRVLGFVELPRPCIRARRVFTFIQHSAKSNKSSLARNGDYCTPGGYVLWYYSTMLVHVLHTSTLAVPRYRGAWYCSTWYIQPVLVPSRQRTTRFFFSFFFLVCVF